MIKIKSIAKTTTIICVWIMIKTLPQESTFWVMMFAATSNPFFFLVHNSLSITVQLNCYTGIRLRHIKTQVEPALWKWMSKACKSRILHTPWACLPPSDATNLMLATTQHAFYFPLLSKGKKTNKVLKFWSHLKKGDQCSVVSLIHPEGPALHYDWKLMLWYGYIVTCNGRRSFSLFTQYNNTKSR